ncbi:MAG TPA: peptide chain release factor 2 [Patescibacteria group bacterium]|jgi:peptide chain release factor 2|nr:peptide chain release factor 2 [Patescibacteria group bacterium]
MNDLVKQLTELLQQVQSLKSQLNLAAKQQRILELEDSMQAPNFWDDQETAQSVNQEYNQLKEFTEFWESIEKNIKELQELVSSNTDESEETTSYLKKQVEELVERYTKNRLIVLMSKKYDDHNAIFSIHAGAGGTDAQDWAEMLLRQYLRYCERKGLRAEIIDQSKGGEAGIKSVTVQVQGPFAYGLLRSEAGVHRLVRQSPFNPAHTRETSFALLELLPQLEEAEAVKLDPKDIEVKASTSSGAGGQSVNTTYSAITITHIPTGIKVSIQNERSQHQNKELAMKILLARVQAVEDEKLADEKKELRGEFKSAEWGNQIRSYVLHPYKMVKDHRTNYEETDPDKVLDGELDNFVEKFLESEIK